MTLTDSTFNDLLDRPRPAGVVVRQDGHALHLVLSRPDQLNAITHEMVTGMRMALEESLVTPGVAVVVLSGAGPRGLSAGGDLRFLYEQGRFGGTRAEDYWTDLYELCQAIAKHPIPVVALLDGLVLGGALGLAGRATHRIVTERSVLGMPETRIGFFPDTGGLHLLSRLPGETGTYLGLCAQTIGASDAIGLGLADHFVWSDDLDLLLEDLGSRPLPDVIARYVAPAPGTPALAEHRLLDRCFSHDDPARILESLDRSGQPWASQTADLLAARSPDAVAVTLAGLRLARVLGLPQDLAMEWRLATRLAGSHDFLEGIRARILGKDRSPRWRHGHVSEVDERWVRSLFLVP